MAFRSASSPPSPRSWPLPARLGVLAPVAVQVLLSLVAVFAAILGELATDPVFFLLTMAFAAISVANLTQAWTRFIPLTLTMTLVCGSTLRLVQVLVSSPAELARGLDRMVEGRLGMVVVTAAAGASFGALPPSTIPFTRKLLATVYFACVITCSAFVLRVRTGDERMPSFDLLTGVLPLVASVLAALAVSGPSLGQDAPPPASRADELRSCGGAAQQALPAQRSTHHMPMFAV